MGSVAAEDVTPPLHYIAIDIGTTNSGYAYATGKTATEYVVQPSNAERKEPTILLLNEDGTLHSFGKEAWESYCALDEDEDEGEDEGENQGEGERTRYFIFDRFKMDLQKDPAVHGGMQIQARNSSKMFPLKLLFTRVLEYFYKRAKEHIRLALGMPKSSNEWLKMDETTRWILTVPAIWGDRAKQFMMEAALDAGLAKDTSHNNIVIALEPEGAALACREDLLQAAREVCDKSGESQTFRFMVVDCGGGTIDITVQDLDTKTQAVDEVHQPTGGSWGGTFVDEEVKTLIKTAIGDQVAEQLKEEDWLGVLREGVERAKNGMRKEERNERVVIRLSNQFVKAVESAGNVFNNPGQLMQGISFRKKSGCLVVDTALFAGCFDKPLKKISTHMRGLLQANSVQFILLVGGFAESPFLIDHLCQEFESSKCRVMCPKNPSTAVLRGALMFGQNSQVITTRIARYTYGIGAVVPFNVLKHRGHNKVTVGDKDYCDEIFDKVIEIGKAMKVGQTYKKAYRRAIPSQKSVAFKIFRSRERDVEFTSGQEELTTVRIDLPPVSESGSNSSGRVEVNIDFSGTSLSVRACKVDDGEPVKVEAQFHRMWSAKFMPEH